MRWTASPSRLEAFTDGVYAIALTLLVLELRLPTPGEGESMAAATLHEWPEIVAFLVTFAFVGLFWMHHTHALKLVSAVDHRLLQLNLFLLLTVALMPFFTLFLSAYFASPADTSPVLAYGAGIFLACLAWCFLWWRITGKRDLQKEPLSRGFVRVSRMIYGVGPVGYLGATALATISTTAAIAVFLGLPVLYGTLVLGAGFGGISAALELRRLAPEEPVTIVDASESFTMGLANLWALDGRAKGAEHTRPLAALARRGVRVVHADVERIDPGAMSVGTSRGELEAERIVVALGARADLGNASGVPKSARNLYALEGARALHDDLARLRGGRVVILVSSMPFKCPPAPYEAAALAKRFLSARGVDAEVVIATPEPHPLPVFPPEVGGMLKKLVEDRGVVVRNGAKIAGIREREIVFDDGSRLAFDALGLVPPHQLPAVASPLAGASGWIEVDASALATRFANVWAVGDCTMLRLPVGKPIPKAGVLAEGEGLVVARNIASRLRGEAETAAFDGRGTCWIELGDGVAVEGRGEFFATPQPVMRASEPSREALRAKEAFARDRLASWFDAE
jgi:sulfide:quinone oxidoreductase